MDSTLYVAKVGKSVGLKGENRLITDTDFPEQFKKGSSFTTKRQTLTVERYNHKRGVVKFEGINGPEDAKKITNLELFTTLEATKALCDLKKDEFFYFDIIGCEVFEGDTNLGKVKEIERINMTDYLVIDTYDALVEQKNPKSFLIPYIENFVKNTNVEEKKITVEGGLDILEAS